MSPSALSHALARLRRAGRRAVRAHRQRHAAHRPCRATGRAGQRRAGAAVQRTGAGGPLRPGHQRPLLHPRGHRLHHLRHAAGPGRASAGSGAAPALPDRPRAKPGLRRGPGLGPAGFRAGLCGRHGRARSRHRELRLADRSLRGDRQPRSSHPVRAQPGRVLAERHVAVRPWGEAGGHIDKLLERADCAATWRCSCPRCWPRPSSWPARC